MADLICTQFLADEDATVAFGSKLAAALQGGEVIYLNGDLGAGKTTLSRGILRGLGHSGAVKSPTFTLVEPYESANLPLYHFDFYRLADPEELEYIGIDEYQRDGAVLLIEWPDKGIGVAPAADIRVDLSIAGESREVAVTPLTQVGSEACAKLKKSLE